MRKRFAIQGAAFLILLVGLSARVEAQLVEDNGPTVAALRSRLTDFFDTLVEGRTPEAYKELLVGSPLGRPDRQSQREQLIKKTAELETAYGRPVAYEPLVVRKVGSDVVVCKYLYKCENYPVVWHVIFYREIRDPRSAEKPNGYDNWRVVSVRFDTDLESLAR